MHKKLLAGAAGLALIAAGAARADEAPPSAEASGPTFSVQLDSGVSAYKFLTGPPEYQIYHHGVYDVKFDSGFGVTLYADGLAFLPPPAFGWVGLTGRVYRAMGPWGIGLIGGVSRELPGVGPTYFDFGIDGSYESDRWSVEKSLFFFTADGMFTGFGFNSDVTFSVNERVDVTSSLEFDYGSGWDATWITEVAITAAERLVVTPRLELRFEPAGLDWVILGLNVAVPLGAITPYLDIEGAFQEFVQIELGVDLEKQIKDTAFWLVGNAGYQVEIEGGVSHQVFGEVGLRYVFGDPP